MATIEVVDGCMVKIHGISSERAGEITKDWDFNTNCELEVKTRLYPTPKEPQITDSITGKDDA